MKMVSMQPSGKNNRMFEYKIESCELNVGDMVYLVDNKGSFKPSGPFKVVKNKKNGWVTIKVGPALIHTSNKRRWCLFKDYRLALNDCGYRAQQRMQNLLIIMKNIKGKIETA